MNKKILISTIIVGILTIGLGVTILAATNQAGSSEDPLVTKSYVDNKTNEILKALSGMEIGGNTSGELSNQQVSDLVNEIISQLDNLGVKGSSYKTLELKANQTLIGTEGTEIILRSGKAKIISEVGNGVTNITSGKDMLNGTNIVSNNLLIIPRNDGRGIIATADSWVLVKGDYNIK